MAKKYGSPISVRFEEEFEERIKRDADANERKPAEQVRWIVKEHYRREREQTEKK